MSEIEQAVADLEGAVTAKREEIRETRAALDQLRNQPLPYGEAMARVDEYIARRSAEYRDGAGIAAFAAADARPGSLIPAHNPEPALCFFFPETIRDRLDGELEELAAADGASLAERSEQAGQLRDRLLALEQEEEQLIRQAEAAGVTIHRRADADPRAVLA